MATTKTKGLVKIESELCKGCGLCIDACNRGLLVISVNSINCKGYKPIEFNDPEGKCTACALCAIVCPDIVLTVFKETKLEEKK